MRGTWRTGLVAWIALTGAVTGIQAGQDGGAISREEASRYAMQLNEVSKLAANAYIRPVPVADLVVAALKGLYKAADQVPPPDLPARVTAAAKRDVDLLRLIAAVRVEVGDVESIRNAKAINASLAALAESLDPYCAFSVERGAATRRIHSNEFGLGMDLAEICDGCPLTVKKVVLGGPAQKAGIRPGDEIVELNHMPARAEMFRLPDWSATGQAVVDFRRPGDSRKRRGILKVDRLHGETVLGVARQPDNSWDYWVDAPRRIAQVRIVNLEEDTATDLGQVLLKLQAEGLAGLILDLRWCPGGYLRVSQAIADIFLGEYNFAYFLLPTPNDLVAQADPYLDNHCENAKVHYRDGHLDNFARSPSPGISFVPIIVLTNSDTSGGAELIAAVLQDNHRARVMGQRTRGKASVQYVLDLMDSSTLLLSYRIEGQLKISNGLIYRPSGKNLNRFPDSRREDQWGVMPDPGLEYHLSPQLSKQLQTWWSWQDLRPGNSNESLPLDTPDADPQRQAALRILQKAR